VVSGHSFAVTQCGVDDLTIGFDMTGSGCIGRLEEMPGLESRRGKMLGDRSSWGTFAHLLGRSVSFWRRETSRLYVQAKLAEEGELCAPPQLRSATDELLMRMALVGLTTYEPAWVTRIDVAVDAVCRPADGKLLLDALEASRLPNGWRVRSVGSPRSTVYFVARVKDDAKARSYCRNLKTRQGEPFGRIRLEAQARYGALDMMLDDVLEPSFSAAVWHSRYGQVEGTVTRHAREAQAAEVAGKVGRREMTYAQGERMSMFLDLERLGLAATYYPKSVLVARKREARSLGMAANDAGMAAIDVDVEQLCALSRGLRGFLAGGGGHPRGSERASPAWDGLEGRGTARLADHARTGALTNGWAR
jgi:hypothetical protein